MSRQNITVEMTQYVTVYHGKLLGMTVVSDGSAASYVKVYTGDAAVDAKLLATAAMPVGGVCITRDIHEIGFIKLYVEITGPVDLVVLHVDCDLNVNRLSAQGYGIGGYGEGDYGY